MLSDPSRQIVGRSTHSAQAAKPGACLDLARPGLEALQGDQLEGCHAASGHRQQVMVWLAQGSGAGQQALPEHCALVCCRAKSVSCTLRTIATLRR